MLESQASVTPEMRVKDFATKFVFIFTCPPVKAPKEILTARGLHQFETQALVSLEMCWEASFRCGSARNFSIAVSLVWSARGPNVTKPEARWRHMEVCEGSFLLRFCGSGFAISAKVAKIGQHSWATWHLVWTPHVEYWVLLRETPKILRQVR